MEGYRVLTTLLLMRSGYAYVPYSSLESVIENSKEGYYLALRQTQKTIRSPRPNWQPWAVYFLRALQQQKQRLEKKIERERLVLGTLPELSLQIVEAIKERGRMTIGEIVNLTGANRNTVKKHVATLVEINHLAPTWNRQGNVVRQTLTQTTLCDSTQETHHVHLL
ncbi:MULTISPECIES: helix-turn-helix domain-containing protein [Mesorhizobium]|uniref:Fic family protein n=1 Tax=unclassified Mesorhizobium TaxID=325217 RepID=UPI000689B038|nr:MULTISPECIES: helix-turn-helix domain-containing protein [Mesorhizobium]